MSTSNSTSTNAPSGPSKFRKDAAIFSPNYQQPPPVINYPPDYPYMYGYNGYMMYQPQYEYNPYMPMQYMPPGQFPYMPVNGMYMNNFPMAAPNVNQRPPRAHPKKPFNKNTKSYSSSETPEESVLPKTPSTDTLQSEPTVDEDTPSAVEEPTSEAADASSEVLRTEPNFPIFINSNWEDVKKEESNVVTRKELFDNKNVAVGKFMANLSADIIVNKSRYTLIDYNTNTTTNVNEINDVPTSNNDIIEKDSSPQTLNWASVLKSSAPSGPLHRRARSKTANGAVATATSVSPAPPTIGFKPASPLETESQPMGVLSLKTMFDPGFSVLEASSDISPFQIAPRGLTNTGNICYMNAILQVLLYCEPFNKLFKLIDSKAIGSLDQTSKTPLIDAVVQFFKDFSPGKETKSLSPEKFYNRLTANEKFSHLKWGQQEDAEEFLTYLLDGLHEEFVEVIKSLSTSDIDLLVQKFDTGSPSINSEFRLNVKNAIKIIKKHQQGDDPVEEHEEENGWSEVGSNSKAVSAKRTVEIEPSPIKTIFGGQFRSVLQLPKAKENQSITLDPYQCIQLDISDEKITTIEEAFIHLNEPEAIPFKSSQNKEVIAKKQTFIDQLPHVLIIQLKRFSYQNENEKASPGIEKLKKKMAYSHNLAIPTECFSSVIKKQPGFKKEYQLTGVVYHHGFGAEGGHYTADVLRKKSLAHLSNESAKEEWIRIDDTQIVKIQEKDVLQENNDDDSKSAYILIYQKV